MILASIAYTQLTLTKLFFRIIVDYQMKGTILLSLCFSTCTGKDCLFLYDSNMAQCQTPEQQRQKDANNNAEQHTNTFRHGEWGRKHLPCATGTTLQFTSTVHINSCLRQGITRNGLSVPVPAIKKKFTIEIPTNSFRGISSTYPFTADINPRSGSPSALKL
jgi:hypothetical protein